MVSTASSLTPRGDPKHGGELFTLPREIRDIIYRLLVKGRYLVFRLLDNADGVTFVKCGTMFTPDLVILRISRVIGSEAQEIFYSESIFQYCDPFTTKAILNPQIEAVNRMKKIEIYIQKLEDRNIMAAICENIIGDFTGIEVVRDTLHINFTHSGPGITKALIGSHFLPRMGLLYGFHTVAIKVTPRESFQDTISNEGSVWESQQSEARQAIIGAMQPTLGPAIIRDDNSKVHLEFHPRRHAPAIMRAQAQQLWLDADILEQGD